MRISPFTFPGMEMKCLFCLRQPVDTLNDIGALIYGTDVNGTIIVTTNSEAYSIQTER